MHVYWMDIKSVISFINYNCGSPYGVNNYNNTQSTVYLFVIMNQCHAENEQFKKRDDLLILSNDIF